MILKEEQCHEQTCPFRFGQESEACRGKSCMMWVWLDYQHTYGTCGLIQVPQKDDKLMD